MFRNFRNNYYFGKAGQADLKPEDLPKTRMQLFSVTLRTRLGSMFRVNILYTLVWIPTIIVLFIAFTSSLELLMNDTLAPDKMRSVLDDLIFWSLLWLIPCITITGPFTAGVSKIMRNWARDEHAFVWSDFKDAVKENWKQGLLVSFLTSLFPAIVYSGYTFYGDQAAKNAILLVPQALVAILGVLWAISVTYMYPLMVCYEMKTKDLFRNAFLLGVARLPQSVGIRLLLCVPAALAFLAAMFIPGATMYALLFLIMFYALIGFCLSRFITASYCNGVFDRFINSHIEGMKVNRGMAPPEEDIDEETEEAHGGAPED